MKIQDKHIEKFLYKYEAVLRKPNAIEKESIGKFGANREGSRKDKGERGRVRETQPWELRGHMFQKAELIVP